MRIVSAEQYNRGFSDIRFYKVRIAEGGKYATCFVNNKDDEVMIQRWMMKQFVTSAKTRVVATDRGVM